MSIHAKDINEQTPWQEMTEGGEIYEGGTARLTITGQWRSNVPVGSRTSASSACCAPPSARTAPSP